MRKNLYISTAQPLEAFSTAHTRTKSIYLYIQYISPYEGRWNKLTRGGEHLLNKSNKHRQRGLDFSPSQKIRQSCASGENTCVWVLFWHSQVARADPDLFSPAYLQILWSSEMSLSVLVSANVRKKCRHSCISNLTPFRYGFYQKWCSVKSWFSIYTIHRIRIQVVWKVGFGQR
jgi:hypothetical protein